MVLVPSSCCPCTETVQHTAKTILESTKTWCLNLTSSMWPLLETIFDKFSIIYTVSLVSLIAWLSWSFLYLLATIGTSALKIQERWCARRYEDRRIFWTGICQQEGCYIMRCQSDSPVPCPVSQCQGSLSCAREGEVYT